MDFVQKSNCSDGTWMVCCAKPANPVNSTNVLAESTTQQNTITTRKESQQDFIIRTLVPSRRYCGLQHTDDRFYTDTETALDEFPWMVHLLFEHSQPTFAASCSGFLITRRYVLTHATCALDVTKVRLGEYNTNENVSCVPNPDFPECTEPSIELNIEEVIRGSAFADIFHLGLLRLEKDVVYTDFIRPICLPLNTADIPLEHQSLTFSGWGGAGPNAVVKKRVVYNVTTGEKCNSLGVIVKKLFANDNGGLMCLSPIENNDQLVCGGDRGGPLMHSERHQWFAVGIISRSYDAGRYCSIAHPIVGTKIKPDAIEWILDNLRP